MTEEPTDGGRAVVYGIGEEERPSEAVVRGVADRTGTPALELDPLYGTVDPEHVDGVVGVGGSEIAFEYAGCAVTVTAEEVRVRAREGEGR